MCHDISSMQGRFTIPAGLGLSAVAVESWNCDAHWHSVGGRAVSYDPSLVSLSMGVGDGDLSPRFLQRMAQIIGPAELAAVDQSSGDHDQISIVPKRSLSSR